MPTIGSQYIFAVAQRPGGPASNLVTLAPLAGLDGSEVNPSDFPSHGLVFWRLNGRESFLVEPGLLIVGSLDSAPVSPAEHAYRIQSESAREPDVGELIELLSFPGTTISHPRDVLLGGQHTLDRPPAQTVMVKGQNSIYGFFRTDSKAVFDEGQHFEVNLSAVGTDLFEFRPEDFDVINNTLCRHLDIDVSLDDQARTRNWVRRATFTYTLLLKPGIVKLRTLPKNKLSARTPAEVLKPLIDRYRNSQSIDAFDATFNYLINALAEDRLPPLPTQVAVLENVQVALQREKKTLKDLTQSLFASGQLDEPLEAAKQALVAEYIQEQSAEITQKLKEAIAAEQETLDGAKLELYHLQQTLAEEKRRHDEQLRRDKEAQDQNMTADRKALDKKEAELERKRTEVNKFLAEASAHFATNRDEIIHTYLALEPLLTHCCPN
jgi:hypothetical protein